MDIRILKQSAKRALEGKWWIAIGALVIYEIINSLVNSSISSNHWIENNVTFSIFSSIGFLITIPLQAGIDWLFLDIYDGKEVSLQQIFDGFKQYGKVLGASILIGLFTVLWSLVFIIPGIIKSISYSQTIYILKENPELGIKEAIEESQRLMDGYKGIYFILLLQFIGWLLVPLIGSIIVITLLLSGLSIFITLILGILSLIGLIASIFYLLPYYSTIFSGFYRELPNKR